MDLLEKQQKAIEDNNRSIVELRLQVAKIVAQITIPTSIAMTLIAELIKHAIK